MERPDEYLDKLHSQMEKLYQSGGMQKGLLTNIPERNYVINSKEKK